MNGKAKLYINCTGSTGSSNVIYLKGSYYQYFYLSKEEDEIDKPKRLVKCGPDPYPGNILFPSWKNLFETNKQKNELEFSTAESLWA